MTDVFPPKPGRGPARKPPAAPAGPAWDPKRADWSMMTKTHGGTVSFIRGLTFDEARKLKERLNPYYGVKHESKRVHPDFVGPGTRSFGHSLGWSHRVNKNEVDVIEVFGPAGWGGFLPGEVEFWPKFITVYTDADGEILGDDYQEDPAAAASARLERAHIEAFEKEAVARASVTERPVEEPAIDPTERVKQSWLARLLGA